MDANELVGQKIQLKSGCWVKISAVFTRPGKQLILYDHKHRSLQQTAEILDTQAALVREFMSDIDTGTNTVNKEITLSKAVHCPVCDEEFEVAITRNVALEFKQGELFEVASNV